MCSGNPLFSLREGTTSNMTRGSEGASTISQSNRFSFENPRYTNLHVKATVLLQAHFSTQSVSGNLALDLLEVLLSGSKIASSNGWFHFLWVIPRANNCLPSKASPFRGIQRQSWRKQSLCWCDETHTHTHTSGIAVVLFSIRQRLHHHDQVLIIY
jgi:pre-mRNA-splicing helicase BRR2